MEGVKRHAIANYEIDGWDVFVEYWETAEFEEWADKNGIDGSDIEDATKKMIKGIGAELKKIHDIQRERWSF